MAVSFMAGSLAQTAARGNLAPRPPLPDFPVRPVGCAGGAVSGRICGMKIKDILAGGRVSVSLEVFPPKKDEGFARMREVVERLCAAKPSFMSVTFGAGGGRDAHTADVAGSIEARGVTALAHQTCVGTDPAQLPARLALLRSLGVENILALRGDLPEGAVAPAPGFFAHASDLVRAIRAADPSFCVGGACYPECHPESPHTDEDVRRLKEKVDAGCDFLTTQMFFDNALFYRFLWKVREAGIGVPVVAGIMPITNGNQVARAQKLSGSFMPRRFTALVDKFGDKPAAMEQAGVAYATDQIVDLIANGVRAVHVYTMNKPQVAEAILRNLSEILAAG